MSKQKIQPDLQQILNQACLDTGFSMIVFTDYSGLPIASSTADIEIAESQSAIVSMLQKMVTQVNEDLNLASSVEIVMNDANGRKMVIKPFSIAGSEFILAVQIPEGKKTYRRALQQVTKLLQLSWII